MSLTSNLIDLISTMTGPEKRHFKRWLHSSDQTNQYVQLFDMLAKKSPPSEAELKTEFPKLTAPGITNLKNYLHSLILRALSDFHRKGSVKIDLRGRLNEIEVMVTKGFLDQGLVALKKLRKRAYELEALSIAYLSLEQQENIYARSGLDKVSPNDWEKLYQAKRAVASKVGLIDRIRQLERRILMLNSIKGAIARSTEMDDQVDVIVDQLPKEEEMDAAPFDAQFRYHQVLATAARMKLNHDVEVVHFQSIVDLINDHPLIKKSYYYEYYPVAVHNLINACFLSRNLEPVADLLEELEGYSSDHKVLHARNFYYSFHNRMAFNKYSGNYQKTVELHAIKVDELTAHEQYLNAPALFHIHFTLAEAYFWIGEYREASDQLKIIVEDHDMIENEDLGSFARFLMILIHFEKEDFEYLGHLIGVCERYLKKKSIMHQTEKELLTFFRKVHRNGKWPFNQDWLELKSILEDLSSNTYEDNLGHTFDVKGYVQSKLA
ncbi:MAG: hypothetical protein ACI9YU_001898 [Flavobacteriales bacterium]|jgi:hypothetical protein